MPKSDAESLGFSRMEVLNVLEDSENGIQVSSSLEEDSEILLKHAEEVELTPLVTSVRS